MNATMLLVLVHNALHAGSPEVVIPGTDKVLPVSEYPHTGVRYVIAKDVGGVRHEFMTQNKDEQSNAGSLARLGVAITRERVWVDGRPGVPTERGVVDGHFTHEIQSVIQRELENRTLAA